MKISFKVKAGILISVLAAGAAGAILANRPHSYRECVEQIYDQNLDKSPAECRAQFPKTEVEILRDQVQEQDLENNRRMSQMESDVEQQKIQESLKYYSCNKTGPYINCN